MKAWAKIIKISKAVLFIAAILFLTSCSGILPEQGTISQDGSLFGVITPENNFKSKSSSICLDVPYQRYGGVNWCLPASAAMTLDFFGLHLSQQELAKKIIKPDGLGDINKMVKFAKELGFTASFTVLTLEEIEGYLSNQIPLITIQKYKESNPLAHARVIIGYDAEKKQILTNDPTIGEHYAVSYEQFLRLNLTSNSKYSMAIVIIPA